MDDSWFVKISQINRKSLNVQKLHNSLNFQKTFKSTDALTEDIQLKTSNSQMEEFFQIFGKTNSKTSYYKIFTVLKGKKIVNKAKVQLERKATGIEFIMTVFYKEKNDCFNKDQLKNHCSKTFMGMFQ